MTRRKDRGMEMTAKEKREARQVVRDVEMAKAKAGIYGT